MKKTFQKLTALSLLTMTTLAWANADIELQNRLNKVDTLSDGQLGKRGGK